MNALSVFLVAGFMSLASLAHADTELYTKVLNTKEVKELTAKMKTEGYSIMQKVEYVMGYRCPCWDFSITYGQDYAAYGEAPTKTFSVNAKGFGEMHPYPRRPGATTPRNRVSKRRHRARSAFRRGISV